jgi:paraquat-inducible protein B
VLVLLIAIADFGRLVTTLDRRMLDAFDTLDRLGETTEALDSLADDGGDLMADLRARLDRWDARINADLDELKAVLLAKLGEIDVGSVNERLNTLESSLANIETAVTRMDAVVEGTVEAAPGFVTRRVKEATEEVAEELAEEMPA